MRRFVQLRKVEKDLYRVEAVFFSNGGVRDGSDQSRETITVEAPPGKQGQEIANLLYRSGKWIERPKDFVISPTRPIPVSMPPDLQVAPPQVPAVAIGYPELDLLPPMDRLRKWTSSVKNPSLSILIPSKDRLDILLSCLLSLERTTRGMDVEVIIGDTGSSPKTHQFYNEIGISVVRFSPPFNFSKVCNALAGTARGASLLFLNNDTEAITPDWVDILMRRKKEEIVGAVLVYPGKTKIQHAGLEILRHEDGHFYSSHTGHNRDLAELDQLDFSRAVAATGAFLFVPRKTFLRLGGFDVAYRLDLNDADLCVRARQAGIPVSVCKEVVFVHHESASRKGAWVHPEREWRLFVGRFKSAVLEWQERRPVSPSQTAGKILIVDDYIPDPENGLHYPRARGFIRLLRDIGYRVSFFPMVSREAKQPWTNRLLDDGVEVVTNAESFSEFARERLGFYDTVIVSRPHNFQKTHSIIRSNFPNAKVIYDSEALFFVREELRAKVLGLNPAKAQEEGRAELDLMARADRVIAVSDDEKRIIEVRKPSLAGRVSVWGHLVNANPTTKKFDERSGLLFVGNLGEGNPNEDAIIWFVQKMYSLIQGSTGCALTIVGSSPTSKVWNLASDSIRVTGFVSEEEKVKYYDSCRVFIVPHRFAAGIPWKLHEAMSFGIPSVVTSLIAGQLRLAGKEAQIAQTPDEFVQKTIHLYTDSGLWYSTRRAALDLIQRTCSPQALTDSLRKIMGSG